MARLNITLPDTLYARLEQLRDRINLSKVCATALEKEVKMLEGQPPISDPRIAQLLQRLQSTRERWHQRGYDDGITWAVELATRDELWSVATHLADVNGQQLAKLFYGPGNFAVKGQFGPPSKQVIHKLQQAKLHMQGEHGFHVRHVEPDTAEAGAVFSAPAPPISPMSAMPLTAENVVYHRAGGVPFPGFPESFHPDQRLQYWQEQDREKSGPAQEGEATRVDIDEGAYLEGWRDAVKGIWQTIAPALS